MPHSEEADEVRESTRKATDVGHKTPFDRTTVPTFFFEDPTRDGNVLTQDGITQIAEHKYKAGEYTHLDNFLNPFWTYCTYNFLPMSMAPNMVTTLGGTANLIAYLATWYYLPSFEPKEGESVPPLLVAGNGVAAFLYYTLDCMDGKQARRTGTSSPLGQLFDHGIDCFANMALFSSAQTFVLLGPCRNYLYCQLLTQVTFFAAQWEEYYTGILPHSYGKYVGVTETNYGMALFTLFSSLLDNQAIYSQTLQEAISPILSIGLLPNSRKEPDPIVSLFNNALKTPLRQVLVFLWLFMQCCLIFGCFHRVAAHIGEVGHTALAYSKLLSPFLVFFAAAHLTPIEAVQQEVRYISIAAGLCLGLLAIKVIVFSMARMAYATFQMDIVPIVVVLGFIKWELEYAPQRRLTPLGLTFVLQLLCGYYLFRIMYWTSIAINQLCEKLDVNLLTIKPKKKKKGD